MLHRRPRWREEKAGKAGWLLRHPSLLWITHSQEGFFFSLSLSLFYFVHCFRLHSLSMPNWICWIGNDSATILKVRIVRELEEERKNQRKIPPKRKLHTHEIGRYSCCCFCWCIAGKKLDFRSILLLNSVFNHSNYYTRPATHVILLKMYPSL